jgi:DNA repair protein RecN (Recombination protein N)
VLRALVLRDFVLVASARLELRPGLNVLSGETGAGKSLLVDALGLLTGVRAESGLIRRGADRALVEAEFDDPTPRIASRALIAGGRNHARLDGELVTVAELADEVGRRISVFAQHAHQALLSPAAQRTALDRLLDPAGRAAADAWADAWSERRQVAAELERLRELARDRLQRADLLDLQLEEIDAAALRPGEEDDLAGEARRLRPADRIAGAVGRALAAIDDEGGAADGLAVARRELDDAARLDDRLAPLARDLAEALQASRAIASELVAHLDQAAPEAGRLDQVEGRLTRLQRLFAKYGDGSAAVLAHRDRAAQERAGLDADDRRVRELEQRLSHLDARLATAGERLRDARRDAAQRLAQGAAPLLERLALPGARLEVRVEPADPGPSGADRVRFDFAADAGEPLAPLAAAASGGELSRVMLALWLVTGASTSTLVFDEVDAGVGGRAAAAVGELLAELGRRHQVLVVTHLPQVAAHGAHHLQVGKTVQDGRTVTTVTPLDRAGRERELARMLAGHEGDAPLGAARDLLARADRARQAAQSSSSIPANRAARSDRSE